VRWLEEQKAPSPKPSQEARGSWNQVLEALILHREVEAALREARPAVAPSPSGDRP
jgi:hypothetical protein